MAAFTFTACSPSLQPWNPFPPPNKRKPNPLITKATTEPESPQPDPDDFDDRLAQMRLRYRSGTGKKAEIRKIKTGKKSSPSSGAGIFLPPVPLKEPSSDGLKVDFGFSPFSERLNGRLAMFGICALLLVELGSGKSVLSYHTPSVVLLQLYAVAAVSALYIKYLKEKISVWPSSSADK